ncbi:hypothetical protein Bhyg_12409 [Pseudolycoriella hygida]|uniref:Uncharacterized protein n=1 Tax=Pseudolycoriella hygida TaxID=35572 RepID=A0A9Q0S0D6_9DIPT|nr:hypothetical protein Bhyg_12409 [Pseudolycoriella hygida]
MISKMKRVTKILTVLTVLVIVIVNSVTAEEVEKFDGEGVRRMAGLIGTPLDVTTRSRLSGKAFGQKRSSRSTDVILINRSFRAFRLTSSICTDGTYTADLTPEEAISSMETQVFGVETLPMQETRKTS